MKHRDNTVFIQKSKSKSVDIPLVKIGTDSPVVAYLGIKNGRQHPKNILHKAFNKNRDVRDWLKDKGYELQPDRGHPYQISTD